MRSWKNPEAALERFDSVNFGRRLAGKRLARRTGGSPLPWQVSGHCTFSHSSLGTKAVNASPFDSPYPKVGAACIGSPGNRFSLIGKAS